MIAKVVAIESSDRGKLVTLKFQVAGEYAYNRLRVPATMLDLPVSLDDEVEFKFVRRLKGGA